MSNGWTYFTRSLAIFLSFLLSSLSIAGQETQTDSLLALYSHLDMGKQKAEVLLELMYAFETKDPQQAITYGEEAISLSLMYNLPEIHAKTLKFRGGMEFDLLHFDQALFFNDSAIKVFQSLGDSLNVAEVLNNSGLVYRHNAKCTEATETFLRAKKLASNGGSQHLKDVLNFNYGTTLYICNQYDDVIALSKQMAGESLKRGDTLFYYRGLTLATLAFYGQGSYDSLLHYDLILASLVTQFQDSGMLAECYNNLGLAYTYTHQYEKADSLLSLSANIHAALGDTTYTSYFYTNRGALLYVQGKYAEAIPYFEKGLEFIEEFKQDFFLEQVLYETAQSYHQIGNDKKAAEYLEKAIMMKDSLLKEDIQAKVQELDKKYQTEKMEKELAEEEFKTQEKENMLRKWLIGIFSSAAVLFFAFLYFLSVIRRRKIEEESRRIELEYAVLRAQMNPHFIFNSLNSIQGFFAENDFATGNEFMGAFGQLIRRIMDQSTYERISLRDELDTLELYLQLEQLRLQDLLSYEFKFKADIEDEEIMIPPLSLQPFVESAIWKGIVPKKEAGKLVIGGWEDPQKNVLVCFIEDNGVERQQEKDGEGLFNQQSKAIEITRERLGKKGKLKLFSLKDAKGNHTGTKVEIIIPLED